jgi:CBS domain-containing protein/ribosomal protein S27AE
MAKVKDYMTTDVPRVKSSDTVLTVAETMKNARSSGVAVYEDDKVVGLITARRLVFEFVTSNKKPEDVKASQIMGPFFRIGPDASTKEAARKIIANSITRLGVFDNEKFLGWISLADLTRELGKRRLIEVVRSHDSEESPEILCPNCRGAFMEKVTNSQGDILRWTCPKCGYSL